MTGKYLSIQDLSAYRISFELSQYLWNIVIKWNYFAKDTVGKQFIRAVDSVPANIAEGWGRYYKKEKIQFYRYSYGSIYESLDWNEKSYLRKLTKEEEYSYILNKLKQLPIEINNLINFTNEKLKI